MLIASANAADDYPTELWDQVSPPSLNLFIPTTWWWANPNPHALRGFVSCSSNLPAVTPLPCASLIVTMALLL